MWMNDGTGTGICIVEFDTEQHAEEAVGPLAPPGGPPICACGIVDVDVEVER
jgi:hypothetical protein